MWARRCGFIGIWLIALAAPASVVAHSDTFQFEKHSFTLQLPAGYTAAGDVSPTAGVRTFGFQTEPRSDGTRGMIQVTLIDLKKAPAGTGDVTLDKLATSMIDAVHARRTDWIQKATPQQIAGIAGRRFDWWGSVQTIRFRGVLIVGIKDDVAFALHTQDLTAHASVMPDCEKSLLSFGLTVNR